MNAPVYLWPSLALAFGLELAALAAFGMWAFHAGARTSTSVALAVGAVLTAALVWGLIASPRAPFSSPVLAPVVTVVFLGAAALALRATGHPRLAAGFLVLVVINTLLLHLAPAGTTAAEGAATQSTGCDRAPSSPSTIGPVDDGESRPRQD
ncbi:MAG: YrdB family protein [Nakamurella sp.]